VPHFRKRYVEKLIQRAVTHAPIVGVFGQRQVGKTTLLETIASEYKTLDDEGTFLQLERDPKFFLQNRPRLFAIDEAQFSPRLFPAVKEHVRVSKKVGQFILSGSVRFTSRKAIRESLTGRIATIEVLPFTHSEAHQAELPSLLKDLTGIRNQKQLELLFAGKELAKVADFEAYLQLGGLPGIAFFRSAEVRADRWQSQIDTLLNRDLRLVQNTTLSYQALRDLLEYLATRQGKPFEIKDAVSFCQISSVTIKKLLFAYESLFLIRVMSCRGDQKKSTYFFEDQGFASWIGRTGHRGLDQPTDMIRGLYANLRQELHYRPEENGRIYQFRTKNDVEVPLVFDSMKVKVGIVATLDSELRSKTLATALAFIKKNRGFKCVIAYRGKEAIARSEDLFLVPFAWLI
jgi:predicted AAA+ superfamily ATPase